MLVGIEADVRRLVRGECANHYGEQNGVSDYCCLEPEATRRKCIYVAGGVSERCGWFEKGVLPLNKRLEALYWADRKARAGGYELGKAAAEAAVASVARERTCTRCQREFMALSNRQKYCEACRRVVRREQVRRDVAKSRGKTAYM